MTDRSTGIKALIFDFDGLILDTETPDFQSWQEIYRTYGGSLSFAEWARWIGTIGAFDPYDHLEKQLGRPVDRAAVRARRRARFDELMAGQSILPGVLEYVQEAKRLGLKLGIASSSGRDWIVGNLGSLGLARYFDSVSSSDDVEHTKPDPALYRAALDALGVEAHQAIALEDSPNGVLAAKRAGIYCVAVPNALTRQLSFDHADLQVGSLADLPLEELLEIGARHLARGVAIKIHEGWPAAEDIQRIQAFLEQDEAANNLPLGLLPRPGEPQEPIEEARRPLFAFAEHDDQIALVMMRTPPHNLIVCGAGQHLDAAIEASVSFLLGRGTGLPGVIGSRDVATRFASVWSRRTGCTLTVQMEQMIYRLDRVNDLPLRPGRLICATAEHTDLVADWTVAFSEVTHERLGRPEALTRAQEMIAASRVYLWLDEAPVSMAWRARPTRNGIVVTGVYTPPEFRTRGYATACVASLSRLLLDEGFQFCALYADLANPVSNHIYVTIGYRPIQASIVYSFGLSK